jgi:ADP-ribose pyrophosphatase YjhB (NUDIX family)
MWACAASITATILARRRPNSMVPSVTVAVRDEAGRILLVHKIDNDYWALPGGAVDLGESVTDAALPEIAEEAGVTIELAGS